MKQGIIPESAVDSVKELFVPEEAQEAAKKEAETLDNVEINKVRDG